LLGVRRGGKKKWVRGPAGAEELAFNISSMGRKGMRQRSPFILQQLGARIGIPKKLQACVVSGGARKGLNPILARTERGGGKKCDPSSAMEGEPEGGGGKKTSSLATKGGGAEG